MNQVDLNRLVWLAAGAGSKGVAAGLVGGIAPQTGITPDIATAFVGFWLAQQPGERIGPFGEGMLISSVGQMVRQPIEKLIGGFLKPTPAAAATPPANKTANQGSPDENVDAYLDATYQIK